MVALGRIILLAPLTKVKLCQDHIQEIVRLTEDYLELSEGPVATNKISGSLFPLLEAAYAPQVRQVCSPADINVLQQLIYYSLEIYLAMASPEELGDEMEYILCLQWYAPTRSSGKKILEFREVLDRQVTTMNNMERRATRIRFEAPQYRLPSLQTVSRIKLATGGIGLRNSMKRIREIIALI